MLIIFLVLIIIASIILGLVILIQNPKGGGLSATFGGVGNQLMGVKQTTDVLEKGTWLFASIVGILCLTSAMFIPKSGSNATDQYYNAPANTNTTTPKNATPLPAPATNQPVLPAPAKDK